jgi:hypothetical protein
LNPFGCLLQSDIQIIFWKIIQRANPVWYFDATGIGLMRSENQGLALLYTFSVWDPFIKVTIPIAQFITTEHSSASISRYLVTIKSNFEKLYRKSTDSFSIGPVIVMDESWASINSVCKIFNQFNMAEYMKYFNRIILVDLSTQIINLLTYI